MEPDKPIELFVPGRICLLGEHSDWAGSYRRFNSKIEKGYCIVAGTNQGLYAKVSPHPNMLIIRSTTDSGATAETSMPMQEDELRRRAKDDGDFFAYCAGVALCVMQHYQVHGLVINNFRTDLPVKKGLSSSAAVCVLTARAFNRIYDLKLTVRGEMNLAYSGEIETSSRCGRMDQCCAFGRNCVLMSFDGDSIDTQVLSTKCPLYLVIVDLKASKDTKEILGKLNRCYPFPETDVDRGVHQMLGPRNKEYVDRAVAALAEGDAERLGQVMIEYQQSFDTLLAPVCPSQLTAPVLHSVLNYEPLKPYLFGCKGIGSQGDGSAQLLAKSRDAQRRIVEIIEGDLKMACLTLTLGNTKSIRKALIPIAGTQRDLLFPANFIGTGMLPVLASDQLIKPAILILVEELVLAGIEQVIIVVREMDLPLYQRLFHEQLPSSSLSPASQAYSIRVQEFGRRVELIVQENSTCLGDAILASAAVIGDTSFLMLMGDYLCTSKIHDSCVQQMLDSFTGAALLGLCWTSSKHLCQVSCVNGHWEDTSKMAINVFAESPTIEFARDYLIPPTTESSTDKYLGVSGHYILPPEIFEYLKKGMSSTPLDFTTALNCIRRDLGLQGLLLRGACFNLGHPNGYIAAFTALAKPQAEAV